MSGPPKAVLLMMSSGIGMNLRSLPAGDTT